MSNRYQQALEAIFAHNDKVIKEAENALVQIATDIEVYDPETCFVQSERSPHVENPLVWLTIPRLAVLTVKLERSSNGKLIGHLRDIQMNWFTLSVSGREITIRLTAYGTLHESGYEKLAWALYNAMSPHDDESSDDTLDEQNRNYNADIGDSLHSR
jgi:hypothetical protein